MATGCYLCAVAVTERPWASWGLRRANLPPHFEEQDLDDLYGLVRRAETALEDMRLQQQVFAVLERLGSELDQIQEWRSIAPHMGDG